MALQNTNYLELFPALGKFITDKKLQDVCVMEFEDGIIIAGSVLYDRRGGVSRAQETFVLSAEDLEKLTGKRGLSNR